MANQMFSKGRQGFLDGSIDWDTDDIRCMLALSSYTFDDSDMYVSDLGAVDNGRSAALSGKTVVDGVADAADTSLAATAATSSKAIIIFKHTGSDATARLIVYVDAPTAGLPFTPSSGQTVNITWNDGTNKIFKL